MFTGIIQEVGRVKRIVRAGSLLTIAVESKRFYADTAVSDSIAINGVCLTVIKKNDHLLFFEAVEPTYRKTNLKRLCVQEAVNLEPALKVGDKLGGHFVLGHVDIELKLRRSRKERDHWQIEIDLPPAFRKNIIAQGSVALDGISLTVYAVSARSFSANIIPFTYEHTNLKNKRTGSWLNVEFDYLLKKNNATSG